MNGRPAFQFYPADYLSDEKVQAMSIEGEGCYIRLMCFCWREGSIPSDRESIARLCKGYDGAGLDEAIACFSITRNHKRMTHKRLTSEYEKQLEYHKSLSDAGLRGAEKRWPGHSRANARPMAKNASSSSSSSSSSNTPLSIGVVLPPIPKTLSFKVIDYLKELKAGILADERLLKNEKAMQRKGVSVDDVQKRMHLDAEKYIQAIEDRA